MAVWRVKLEQEVTRYGKDSKGEPQQEWVTTDSAVSDNKGMAGFLRTLADRLDPL